MSTKVVVGIAWYSEEQWTMLKLVADDRDSLDASYQEWQAGTEEPLKQLRGQPGIEVVKVPIEVDALRQWCRERGKPLDSAARAAYASEKVRSMEAGEKSP